MDYPEAITQEDYEAAREHAERREQAFDNLRLPFQEVVEPAVPDEEWDDETDWNFGEIFAMAGGPN